MLARVAPIDTAMGTPRQAGARQTTPRGARTAALVATLAAGCAILGGCGTPAVIKPSSTPLPGLERDIHAAQKVVAQTEREAQSDASPVLGSQ
jgi:hypothetical protein